MKQLLITIVFGVYAGSIFSDQIHEAAAKGDIEAMQSSLDKGGNVNAKKGAASVSPLILSILNSHIKMAEVLITNGADLEGKDKFGNTPLHYASKNGNQKIVKFLIAKNADVNAKDKAGETPLDMAANRKIAEIISRHNGKYGTFISAVASGDINAIKIFLSEGKNVNEKVQHGWTPMHEAAVFGHTEVAILLIKKGANVNAWDGYETPLDVSINESEFANILRKHGAKKGGELNSKVK